MGRAREAQKVSEAEASLVTQVLSKEEASTKVQGFFSRLQQDMKQREATAVEIRRSQEPSPPPRRHRARSSKRSTSLPSGGKRRRGTSRIRAPAQPPVPEDVMAGRRRGHTELRGSNRQKSSTL